MLSPEVSTASKIEHGYPHFQIIRKSINALYTHLGHAAIRKFKSNFLPEHARIPPKIDLIIFVQRLAGAMVRHLSLPTGAIIVNFRDMKNPGQVELTQGDGYLVDLHSRYREDSRDIAAVLAHEITHVFLYRSKLRFAETQENEILTDTAAAYVALSRQGVILMVPDSEIAYLL